MGTTITVPRWQIVGTENFENIMTQERYIETHEREIQTKKTIVQAIQNEDTNQSGIGNKQYEMRFHEWHKNKRLEQKEKQEIKRNNAIQNENLKIYVGVANERVKIVARDRIVYGSLGLSSSLSSSLILVIEFSTSLMAYIQRDRGETREKMLVFVARKEYDLVIVDAKVRRNRKLNRLEIAEKSIDIRTPPRQRKSHSRR